MSKSMATSVLWLLSLILAAILVLGLAIVRWVQAVAELLHSQNLYLVQWREQFSQTFQYIEDGDDVDSGIWGEDDDKGAKSWN